MVSPRPSWLYLLHVPNPAQPYNITELEVEADTLERSRKCCMAVRPWRT